MPDRNEPGMLCPVCAHDMSRSPVLPISGVQVFVKYVGANLGGITSAVIIGLLAMPVLEYVFDVGDMPLGSTPRGRGGCSRPTLFP